MQDKTNVPEELLDLVDENDQIIGEVLKGEVNKNPSLLHREAAIIIYDNKNRILLQQRSKEKFVHPGLWAVSCAGHIPKGMDPQDAAHVELKEELGFDTDLKFTEKILTHLPNETHFTYWYVGKYPNKKILIEPEEIEQVKFFSKAQLNKFIKSGEKYDRHSIRAVKKFWAGKLQSKSRPNL